MKYFKLAPEVAGELDSDSEVDYSLHPPKVTQLVYLFHGWLGDDLVESFPCYIVTERLKTAILQEELTGYEFEEATVKTSEQFHELYPNKILPDFSWFVLVGKAGIDDFGLDQSSQLVVSEKAWETLHQFQLLYCDVEDFKF